MIDRWLYFQLFHGDAHAADEVLTELVASTSRAMLADGTVDRFFYLRYAEGGHHIRYRLRVTDVGLRESVTRSLMARACATKGVLRVETAIYEPEIDKHGGAAGLELAERQFFASSQLALSCLEATIAEPERRALVAASAMDVLLGHAGLDRAARGRSCAAYARHWSELLEHATGDDQPHGMPSPAQIEVVRSSVDAPHAGLLGPLATAAPGAARWLETLADDMAALRVLDMEGRLNVPMHVVLWNLIHTFANRLGLGIAIEIAISKLLTVVYALPPRPSLAQCADTTDPGRIWFEITQGLSSGQPTAIAIEGDAEAILTGWRLDAEAIAAQWVESERADPDDHRPFALWRRLAQGLEADGAERLERRLADARQHWSDAECPMLPDPAGVHGAISELLLPPSTRPTIVVLRDAAGASPDCLEVLSMIVRRSTRRTAILIIVADADPDELDEALRVAWTKFLRRLRVEAGLHRLALPMGRHPRRPPSSMPPAAHATAGLNACRAGAVASGVHHIATAMAQDERLGDDPQLLVHLAMATLQLQKPDLAAEAAEAAYRAGPGDHRARRVWMAAMHMGNDAEGLDRLHAGVRHDLERSDASSAQAVWLLLDAALCTALRTDRRPEHIAYLDAILALPPSEVPRQCLAIAHIWRAATLFVEGRLAEALPHQRAGAHLLETLADPTRLLFVRLRLGGTLMQQGQLDEAAQLLTEVTKAALLRGDFDTATDAAHRAVQAHVEAGQLDAAARLLHSAERTVRYMWARRPAVTLDCEAMVARASGDPERARTIAETLPSMATSTDWLPSYLGGSFSSS